MKNRETVSAVQMSILFFVFMTGSSSINIPGPLINYAKNGAWISLILSGTVSFLSLYMILYLHRQYPRMTFVDYSRQAVGRWVTIVFAILIFGFNLHMTSGIVLDIGLFLSSSMMRTTPLYIFNGLVFLTVAFAVRSGIEVMARMFTLLIAIIILFITAVLLLGIPNYQTDLMFPVLPEGIKPVLLGAYFAYGFPFTELFLFSMILPHVSREDNKKLGRLMYLSLGLVCFSLLAVTICTLLTFGPEMSGERKYALYSLARTIEVQEIIQRIESVIGISLVAGSFMKASISLYTMTLVATHLFRIDNGKLLVFPLALLGLLLSLGTIQNEAEWVEMVSVIHPLWSFFSYSVPLLVVFTVTVVRKKF